MEKPIPVPISGYTVSVLPQDSIYLHTKFQIFQTNSSALFYDISTDIVGSSDVGFIYYTKT